jgi:hypothetical protein
MGNVANTPVIMDARKFIKHINNGAGAKLKFFEETIQRFGKETGRPFRLASLDTNSLMFEDTEKNQYYIADIKKVQNGRVAIENVRPIQIVEAEKAEQFNKNVNDLVESIAKNDYREADRVFNKIEGQRYRSRVIPESGLITTRDGSVHKVRTNNRPIKENHVPVLVKMFCESVQDSVEVDKGMVVRGVFAETQEKFVIPINEYTRRRLVARHMKNVAESAYKSNGFQELIVGLASLVCERNINEAVRAAAKFLAEEQEFCMLDQKSMTALVENALAARGEFNAMLAADTGALLYKVNAKVNRDTILEAWTKTAQKAENATLMANVKVLEESKEFHKDYNEFLDVVFNEGADVSKARADAYLKSLQIISTVLPNMENEDGDKMSSIEELNSLIAKLERPEPDTASILQAEELLTGISDTLLDKISTLENFDKMPSSEEDAAVEGEEESQTPVPLPEIESEAEGEMPPAATPAPGQAPGAPAQPGAPGVLNQGVERTQTPVEIEGMSPQQLKEELEAWKLEGETFLKEDGFDDCFKQFDRYISRCLTLGPAAKTLREEFEKMRDTIVETGSEAIIDEDDHYAKSVKVAFEGLETPAGGEASPIPPKGALPGKPPVDKALEAGLPVKGAPAAESKIDRNYHSTIHEELAGAEPRLRMGDKIQDSGASVQPKTAAKAADGRKGDGAQAAQDYAAPAGQMKGKGLRMDDLQGQKSVQTGPVHDADGRKGDGAKAAPEYGMQTKALKDAGSIRMDELQTGGTVIPKSVDSSDGKTAGRTAGGRSKFMPVESVMDTGAKTGENYKVSGGDLSQDVGLRMDKELQAKGGSIQPKGVASADGRKGDGAKAASDYHVSGGLGAAPKSDTSMSAEFQGNKSVQKPGVKAADGRKGDGASAAQSPVQGKGLGASPKSSTDMNELQGKETVAESEDPFSIERIAALIEEAEGMPPMAEEPPAEEAPAAEEGAEAEGDLLGDMMDEAGADATGEVPAPAAEAPVATGAEETAKIAAAAATAAAVAANAAVKAVADEMGDDEGMDLGAEMPAEEVPAEAPEAPAEEAPAEEAPEGEAEEAPEIEESQRKGPTKGLKPRGFNRAKLATEGKNPKGTPVNEDLAAFYTKDTGQEVDQIIASIVGAMNDEPGMGEMPGEMAGGPAPEAPMSGPEGGELEELGASDLPEPEGAPEEDTLETPEEGAAEPEETPAEEGGEEEAEGEMTDAPSTPSTCNDCGKAPCDCKDCEKCGKAKAECQCSM